MSSNRTGLSVADVTRSTSTSAMARDEDTGLDLVRKTESDNNFCKKV